MKKIVWKFQNFIIKWFLNFSPNWNFILNLNYQNTNINCIKFVSHRMFTSFVSKIKITTSFHFDLCHIPKILPHSLNSSPPFSALAQQSQNWVPNHSLSATHLRSTDLVNSPFQIDLKSAHKREPKKGTT